MHTTTIWQPWASLIAIGAKPFETRNYPPPAKLIGQRIAIHAAVRPVRFYEVSAIIGHEGCGAAAYEVLVRHQELPLGAVVATAVLAGAYQVMRIRDRDRSWLELRVAAGVCENSPPPPNGGAVPNDLFGDYGHCRWCWHLTDVHRLDQPVPAKGKQGWWMWDGSPCGLTEISCIDCGAYGRRDCCPHQETVK